MNDLLSRLNPAQRQAVEHLGTPLMIIAGAGTGKTRVITHRIAFLNRVCGIPLNSIMAVTFTNKAAREMRERVCQILGVFDSPGLPIGTFHSRCALILRRDAAAAGLDPNFAILDEKDQKQAIKRVLKDMDISDKRVKPGQVQSFINQAKMRLLTPADCKQEYDEDDIPYPDIYAKYQAVIEKSKSIDFEDLMMRTVMLFQDNEEARLRWATRYQYLLVDEYQDTNHAQFLLTKLLAQDHREIAVVGDEDQSIYSWRGAEISNLLDFEKTFEGTTIVKLEQNYRSTGNILKAASTVIAHNTQRIGKVLFTDALDGDKITFISSRDAADEAQRIALESYNLIERDGVPANEIAIFYRGHWLSRSVEDAMRKYRLPYRIVGGLRFYDRAEVKDLLSFLRLAVNPDDDLAFERVVNVPTRGVGAKSFQSIVVEAAREGLPLIRAIGRMLETGALKGKAKQGLKEFVSAVYNWSALAQSKAPSDVLEAILKDTDYKQAGVGDPNSIEGESRLENIAELETLIGEYKPVGERDQLAEFLNAMALDSSEQQDDGRPKINLLTIHNGKGLEFDYVFIVGLEKGVFPTSRAEDSFDQNAVEEERRLFYVAITRARKKLFLMYSYQRNRPDFWAMTQPSLFLPELPPEVFDFDSVERLRRLLPFGWGQEPALGGTKPEAEPGELEYVMDDEVGEAPAGAFFRQRPAPRSSGPMPRSEKQGLSAGMRVVHKYMGAGVITAIGGRPGWERAQVAFDDGKTQEFVLKYAPLSPE